MGTKLEKILEDSQKGYIDNLKSASELQLFLVLLCIGKQARQTSVNN